MRKLEDLPLVKAQLKEPPPKAAMERSFFSVSELIERIDRTLDTKTCAAYHSGALGKHEGNSGL